MTWICLKLVSRFDQPASGILRPDYGPAGPFYQDLSISPSLSVDYIGFNCKEAPFNDPDIRQAFCLAIDKDNILDLTYRNMAQKAEGILPPGIPGI